VAAVGVAIVTGYLRSNGSCREPNSVGQFKFVPSVR
jgi:hypothetical protein